MIRGGGAPSSRKPDGSRSRLRPRQTRWNQARKLLAAILILLSLTIFIFFSKVSVIQAVVCSRMMKRRYPTRQSFFRILLTGQITL